MKPSLLWMWAISVAVGHARVALLPVQDKFDNSNDTSSPSVSSPLQRRDIDPADFGWIKRWAVIGDSFTAGIGAGSQLSKFWHLTKAGHENWKCSRYDQSYPMVLNAAFGQGVEKFQFEACSGDRSEGIYKQVTEELENNMNLVVMTAGGNDLCLAGMIKKCVFLPYDGEDACTEIIDKAQTNIDTILKPNLKSILLKLNDRMAKDSVVVYNGYAQFFNTDDEATCTQKQDWGWRWMFIKYWFVRGLPLSVARRKRFNELVIGINNAIKEVVEDVQKNGNVKYKLGFAGWDRWPHEGVRGQYCDPKGKGYYPDPDQPDLQFFKPNTYYEELPPLKRREGEEAFGEDKAYVPTKEEMQELVDYTQKERRELYESLLYKSSNPSAEALHRLNPRDAPAPPNCPGDEAFDPSFGFGLPDGLGKNFHPNEKGHQTIAAFAIQRMIQLRAEVLGQDSSCKRADVFRCWTKEGSHGYANGDRMNIDYKDFCDNQVKAPTHEVGWKRQWTYNNNTPDEYTFQVQLDDKASDFDKDECKKSFDKIINSCENPAQSGQDELNWRGGGLWQRGSYTWRLDIKRSNRPWPPPKKGHGDCDSKYKFVLSSFFLHGGGWSTWDHGAETLKKSAGDCIGSTPTSWKFWYYDEPDKDGNEWAASFNTPIWVKPRCFGNDKVQKGAGGLSNGCSGGG